ncbi:MAG: hypothetical protein NZM11_11260, partial [Anaerolineales bacterium]|nr:hypothetical protein [Anaerolineales bacterium]
RAEEQAAEAAPVEQPIADLEQPLGEPNLPDWLTITPEQPAALATAASDIGAPSEDDSLLRWLESLAARQGADPAELITTPEERAAFLAAQAPLPAESAIAEPAPAEPTAVEEMPDRPKTMMAPPEAAAAPPVAPAVAEAPASPASAMPDVSALSEDDALRWLESLAARPTPITEELRSMVAEPESPLAEEPTPEPVIEPPDWVKAPPVAPAPPPAKPPATSALGRDERLARLAERLSAARRAREQEIAERSRLARSPAAHGRAPRAPCRAGHRPLAPPRRGVPRRRGQA